MNLLSQDNTVLKLKQNLKSKTKKFNFQIKTRRKKKKDA